jgi:mannose-6-phosphate isomerase-like protein (cupin superfamily)
MPSTEPHETPVDIHASALHIAATSGLRAVRAVASRAGDARWYRKSAATTTVFALESGLAVQIQKPPFRCTLRAGEVYSVPPGVAMSVFSTEQDELPYVVFEYGNSFAAHPEAPPTLDYVAERPAGPAPVSPPGATPDFDHGRLAPGFSRMDVLAFEPTLRLLYQGCGEGQCVPWHSHDNVSDFFFCSHGSLRIAVRDPDSEHMLQPGQTFEVPRGVPHFVSGIDGAPCDMLILQGTGRYNYIAR